MIFAVSLDSFELDYHLQAKLEARQLPTRYTSIVGTESSKTSQLFQFFFQTCEAVLIFSTLIIQLMSSSLWPCLKSFAANSKIYEFKENYRADSFSPKFRLL